MKKEEHHHTARFLQWFEWFTDIIIPYLLVILALELVIDNPFWVLYDLENLGSLVSFIDYGILFFFVVDLAFKWWHVKSFPKFVKLYWMDMLAIVPFYLAFRIYARYLGLTSTGEELVAAQKAAHEAVLTREERFLREGKPVARALQTIERSLRLASGRHEMTHEGMKHAILKSEHGTY